MLSFQPNLDVVTRAMDCAIRTREYCGNTVSLALGIPIAGLRICTGTAECECYAGKHHQHRFSEHPSIRDRRAARARVCTRHADALDRASSGSTTDRRPRYGWIESSSMHNIPQLA